MKPQFAYWNTRPNDPNSSYWAMFDRLEDAISEAGDGVDVYRLVPQMVVALVRVTAKKRRKVKRKRHNRSLACPALCLTGKSRRCFGCVRRISRGAQADATTRDSINL